MEYASLCGQIAANTRWSRMNADERTAATSAGRLAAEKRFEKMIDPDGVLSGEERAPGQQRPESPLSAHGPGKCAGTSPPWRDGSEGFDPAVTPLTKPGRYAHTELFIKVFPSALESLLSDRTLPAYHRLHLLALARAQPNGHAEFARGAAAKLVGKLGKRHHDVESAIQQAVKYKLLHHNSTPQCLVLPAGFAEPWDKSGRAKYLSCPTHSGTPKPLRTADCHPDRRHKAHGRCDSCYRREIRMAKAMGCEPPWASPCEPTEPTELGEIGGEFSA